MGVVKVRANDVGLADGVSPRSGVRILPGGPLCRPPLDRAGVRECEPLRHSMVRISRTRLVVPWIHIFWDDDGRCFTLGFTIYLFTISLLLCVLICGSVEEKMRRDAASWRWRGYSHIQGDL